MSGWAMVLALATVLAAPPAFKPGPEPPPLPDVTYVVVRTKDDAFVGRDLRYGEGTFRLRQENGDVAVAEADVLAASLLDLPGDELRDPVITLASLLAYPRRAPLFKRFQLLRLREGVFLLPEEPVAEAVPRLAPKVGNPDLAAVLCSEVVRRCMSDRRPAEAITLFQKAETAVKDRPDLAFVYGLMQVAVMIEQGRPVEEALQRLEQVYPAHRREVFRFRMGMRGDGERPLFPRPHKDREPP